MPPGWVNTSTSLHFIHNLLRCPILSLSLPAPWSLKEGPSSFLSFPSSLSGTSIADFISLERRPKHSCLGLAGSSCHRSVSSYSFPHCFARESAINPTYSRNCARLSKSDPLALSCSQSTDYVFGKNFSDTQFSLLSLFDRSLHLALLHVFSSFLKYKGNI